MLARNGWRKVSAPDAHGYAVLAARLRDGRVTVTRQRSNDHVTLSADDVEGIRDFLVYGITADDDDSDRTAALAALQRAARDDDTARRAYVARIDT